MRRHHKSVALKLAALVSAASFSVSAVGAEEVFSPAQAETNAKIAKYSINWCNDLSKAKKLAHEQNKPILWIHILGNMDGFT
ncbi:MAG TPA: hypothetical protein V6C97_18180 [Oculatellaceae cyanobacterium]